MAESLGGEHGKGADHNTAPSRRKVEEAMPQFEIWSWFKG